jgi:gluconokinase
MIPSQVKYQEQQMAANRRPTRPCTIGLDIGTTTVKALAFDHSGQRIAGSSAEVTTLLQDENAEQDPDDVCSLCVEVLARTTASALGSGYYIGRIGISAAMHSILAVSDDDTPLTNAMLWMDGRANLEAEELWSSGLGRQLYQRTGTPVHSMSPLAKLLWLRRWRPDIWRRSARFVSLKEWIWHRWLGSWQIDTSIASSTGLYRLQTGTWDDQALALLDLSPARLSTLVPTTFTSRGLQEPELTSAGLTGSTPVTIGASDGVLANLGMRAIDPGALVLTIGTSCAVRRGSSIPYTNPDTRTFCSVLAPERFIIGGASNSGGVVLDWLKNLLCSQAGTAAPQEAERVWLGLLEQASSSSSEGLVCLPYVAGERAPLWDAGASGLFFGLRLHHRPEHLVRAAVEGLLFNAYWLAEDLLSLTPPPEYLMTTGGVLSPIWIQQLASNIFGLPVFPGSRSDASARGAALLADIAAGRADWPSAARPAEPPAAMPSTTQEYQVEYAHFREVCDRLANP